MACLGVEWDSCRNKSLGGETANGKMGKKYQKENGTLQHPTTGGKIMKASDNR
jgi:hypothetical protein